jgi:hypothetical protein
VKGRPDFDAIARRVMKEINACTPGARVPEVPTLFAFGPIRLAIAEAWNARGAADIALVERELSSMMGATAAGPYIKNLDRALRGLDETA